MSDNLYPNYTPPEGAKKSDQDYLQEIIKDMAGGWIPIKLYLSLYGETLYQVRHRLAAGYWQVGVQYVVPRGSGAWVNVPAVRAWIEAGGGSRGAPRKKGPVEGPSEEDAEA